MAMAAWMRARELAPDVDPHKLIGLGATASLVSDRPKKGDHRVHVATQTATVTQCFSLTFAKYDRDRPAEEAVSADVILLNLSDSCGVIEADNWRCYLEDLPPGDKVYFHSGQADAALSELVLGRREMVCYATD